MKTKIEVPENTYVVHLKGGDEFEAVCQFDTQQILDDGSIKVRTVFKAWHPEFETYYIVQTDASNLVYTEESFTEEIWGMLLDIANTAPECDTTSVDTLFG